MNCIPIKSRQCLNVSNPHDLLLVLVPLWCGGKVLGPSPAKPQLSFLPKEEPSSYVCVAVAM